MIIAEVVGQWTPQKTPQLLIDYAHPEVVSCDDVTGTAKVPPSPNSGVWEIRCTQNIIDLLESDNNYDVLWSKLEDEATE